MPAIRRKSWGQQKPVLGSQLMAGHSLARGLVGCWLFNEAGGRTVGDLATTARSALGSTLALGPAGVRLVGFTFADSITTSKTFNDTAFSYVVRCRPTSNNFSSNRYLLFEGTAGGRNIGTNASGKAWVFNVLTGNYTISANELVTIVHSHIGGTSSVYVNGKIDVSGAVTPATGGTFVMGAYGGGGFTWDGDIEQVSVYNRALTASEVAWLYADPYAMVVPPVARRSYFVAGGGGGTAIPVFMNQYRQRWS
jgi:hypothetical protein